MQQDEKITAIEQQFVGAVMTLSARECFLNENLFRKTKTVARLLAKAARFTRAEREKTPRHAKARGNK